MEAIVELREVTKTFGNKKAVNHVSFTIQKGSVVAILGPNGAGKTTTISMLLGLMEPTQGTVRLLTGNRSIKTSEKRSVRCCRRLASLTG